MLFLVSLVLIVFFFKQKTAYELRISDWSSDVCSSDLTRKRSLQWGSGANSRSAFCAEKSVTIMCWTARTFDSSSTCPPRMPWRCRHSKQGGEPTRSEERRVGKELSVRVDIGGRSIIKKTNNNITTHI